MDTHANIPYPLGYRLDGRVAVVTGAAGGIAQAVVERLGLLGASVALLDLKPETLDGVSHRLERAGIPHAIYACDVSDPESVAHAAQQVRDQLGLCDVLVNNAAILTPAKAIADVDLGYWKRTLAVNLTGVFLTTQSFGAQMMSKGGGSIVNIGSISATTPNGSPPYGVSKAGVLAFTRHTAIEWGPRGIRANSVSPGFVRTTLSEPMYSTEAGLREHRIASTPLRRLGAVEDIAKAVAYLASDASSYVSGQDIVVDGAFTLTALMHVQPKRDQYGGWLG